MSRLIDESQRPRSPAPMCRSHSVFSCPSTGQIAVNLRSRTAGWRSFRALAAALLAGMGWARAAEPTITPAASELGLPLIQNFLARDIPTTTRFFAGAPRFYSGVSDESGLLYFCHKGAVVVYDGSEWTRIPTAENALDLRGLAFGPDGCLYVGGGNFFGRLRRPDWTYESLMERLPPGQPDVGRITQVVSHAGGVYFVAPKALLVWEGERFTLLPCNGGRLHATARGLYLTAIGEPLRRIEGGQSVTVSDDPVFREHEIPLLCDGPAGTLIVCPSSGGLYQLPAGGPAALAPFPTDVDELLRTRQIAVGRRLDDGSLALAFTAASGGSAVFLGADGHRALQLDEASGLQDQIVLGFLPDRDGGLWLSLGSGLARVQWPSAFTYFGRANGLETGSIYAVARYQDALYVANTRGLFRLERSPGPAQRAHFTRVVAGETWSLDRCRDGLLLAMPRSLRWMLSTGEIRTIYETGSAVHLGVALVSTQDPNRVWLGLSHGLSSIYFRDGAWHDEGPVAGVQGNFASLAEADDRTLWGAGPGTGFVRVRFKAALRGVHRPGAEVQRFTAGSGLPTTVTTGTVARWSDDLLFTLSGSNALLRFDDVHHAFAPMPGAPSLAEPILPTAGVSQPDHLWLAVDTPDPTQWRVERSSRGGAVQALPQTTNHPIGMPLRLLEEADADGNVLWVGGNEGLLRVALAQAFVPPSPLIAQVRGVDFTAGAQRTYAQRDARFTFSAPRFQTGSAVAYQSRLVGYEAGWSEWSRSRQRSFTNLPPGHYTFAVRARDTDRIESAPVELAFTILPPWWLRWWAIGLMSAAGIAGVAGATRWFANRALKRRVMLLEAQSAVGRERLRLARDLHDEVGSGLGRVILFAGEAERATGDAEKQRAALARVQATAQDLVQHAREIVWAVSPQHDALASVIERLGDYAQDTLAAAGIACRVETPAPERIPPVSLGSEARHSLFLAVKEIVHNCVKYAEAKTAEFRCEIVADDFVVTLRDHGRGFAPGECRGSGHGLENVAARAEVLGGGAEIVSEPGRGTTIKLRVPLSIRKGS